MFSQKIRLTGTPLEEKSNISKKKVAFICPYPEDTAPGQRFRVELFYDYIKEYVDFEAFHFLDLNTHKVLYKKGNLLKKIFGVFKGFINRFLSLPSLKKYDYIFIFRESSPLGPPIFEFILSKIMGKKLIYDFDDAIWMDNTTKENWISGFLKYHSKVRMICSWSHVVSVGNSYLANYAKQHSKNVAIIPTVVDTVKTHYKRNTTRESKKINVGWTGSHSSLILLPPMIPILQRLQEKYDFNFVLIADKDPKLPLKNYQFYRWSPETEIIDLDRIDIGMMPLQYNEWCKGKCGFKAIQYMALSIPAVVSKFGVNTEIVDHNVNGFLSDSLEDWEVYLEELIKNPKLRKTFGEKAKEKIENNYSLNAVLPDFLQLFDIDISQSSSKPLLRTAFKKNESD